MGPRSHVKSHYAALHFPLNCACVGVCVRTYTQSQVFSDILIMGIYAIN